MRRVQMWVNPDFRKKIKAQAAMSGLSLYEYTRKIAEQEEDEIREEKKIRRLKLGF